MKNRFVGSEEQRNKASEAIINDNKRLDAGNAKARRDRRDQSGAKIKRVKNVRKDAQVYETLIFAAFEKNSVIEQRELCQQIREPWSFLKPIMEKLCDRHKNADKQGRNWVLKPEYRLNTDAEILTAAPEENVSQTSTNTTRTFLPK